MRPIKLEVVASNTRSEIRENGLERLRKKYGDNTVDEAIELLNGVCDPQVVEQHIVSGINFY